MIPDHIGMFYPLKSIELPGCALNFRLGRIHHLKGINFLATRDLEGASEPSRPQVLDNRIIGNDLGGDLLEKLTIGRHAFPSWERGKR